MEKNSKVPSTDSTLVKENKAPVYADGAFVKQKKKVAIVGYAPSSRMLAPFDDEEFEIWGVNELYKIVPRVDVLFELHDRKWFRSKARNPKHLEWLQKSKIPVITLEKFPDMPMSVRFPIEAVRKFLSPYDGYFTNSISYMIALAMLFDYDEIHIYGVDMATDEEYQSQRPSVEFYCGIAAGIYKATGKCFLYVPPECDLMKTMYQYGYDDDKITSAKKKIEARKAELGARINEFNNQARIAEGNLNVMRGAMDNTIYFERCLMGTLQDKEIANVSTEIHGNDC